MVTKEQIDTIIHLRSLGWTQKKISEEVKISRQSVAYQLKKIIQNPAEKEKLLPDMNKELNPEANFFIEFFRNIDTNNKSFVSIGSKNKEIIFGLASIGKRIVVFEDDPISLSKLNSKITKFGYSGLIDLIGIFPSQRNNQNGEPIVKQNNTMFDQINVSQSGIFAIYLDESVDLRTFIDGAKQTIKKNWPIIYFDNRKSMSPSESSFLFTEFNYAGHITANNSIVILNNQLHEREASLLNEMNKNIYYQWGTNSIGKYTDEIDRLRKYSRSYYRKSYGLTKENYLLKKKVDSLEKIKYDVEKALKTCKFIQNTYDSAYSNIFYDGISEENRKKYIFPRILRKEPGDKIEELSNSIKSIDSNDTITKPTLYVDLPYLATNNTYDIKTRVGIASIPARKSTLLPTLTSLTGQVDEIYVSLNGYDEIPPEMTIFDNVTLQISENIGDRAKFKFLEEFEGVYITCDDDIVYPPYYVKSLLFYLSKYNYEVCVGWHGAILSDFFVDYYSPASRKVSTFGSLQAYEKFVNILGTGCLAFHTDCISPPMKIFKKPNIADVYFAIYAQKKKIPLLFVPHMANQAVEVVSEGDDVGSIAGNSMASNQSPMNVRKETNKLVKRHKNWLIHKYNIGEKKLKLSRNILLIGRFDPARWSKGGIYKSCNLMKKQLDSSGFTVKTIDIESPISEILDSINSSAFEIVFVYPGDLFAQDYFPVENIIKNINENSPPVYYNLSFNMEDKRTEYIRDTYKRIRKKDGIFVFTDEAKYLLENKHDIDNIMVIPKTIKTWVKITNNYSDTTGIFMGDLAKFTDPYLTPNAEEILSLIRKNFNCQISFVSQYGSPKDAPDFIKSCKIYPYSSKINDIIANHRVYLHSNRYCTFEMLPIEAMSAGTPVCYIDMPQSLNSYVGMAGLKFEDLNQMIWGLKKIYNSEETWMNLSESSQAKADTFSYESSSIQLEKSVSSKINSL